MKGGTHLPEGRSTWGWTPQEHVRTALHLLGELEHELRGVGSIPEGQYYPARLLSATRRQLWLAVVALDSRGSSPGRWAGPARIARRRGWAAAILLGTVAWVVVAVGFVLRWGWWYTRAMLRGLSRG